MDSFDGKTLTPMLIGADTGPFDSPEHIFELKLDGVRCLAYLDGEGTHLRNKRNLNVSATYPELDGIHRQAARRCILDGELVVMNGGKPDFDELKRRALMSNSFRIRLAAERLPVSFTAFDILYLDDHDVTDLPQMERKKLLSDTISESPRLAVSRYIERDGIALYRMAEEQALEGVVAKVMNSRYRPGTRTKEWIKIKNLLDDDFVVCGYVPKDNRVTSIVLGQYRGLVLVYKGHVTLGVSGRDFNTINQAPEMADQPFGALPPGNENAVWIEPRLVCTVRFMARNESGSLRQPVFKGLRDDKEPEDCREHE
jgi:DNA ligase D-like protein (predicted ligase)